MLQIMVVNNDTAFLQMMRDLLTDEGYETTIEIEAPRAHPRIRDLRPELVILDVRMDHPESGWTILELLRLDPATKDIPVIVCSADTQALRAKEGMLREQDCDVLEKPFDLETLLQLVKARIGPAVKRRPPDGT